MKFAVSTRVASFGLAMVLPACGWLTGSGSAKLTQKSTESGALAGQNSVTITDQVRASTLAIGNTMADELAFNLVAAGLTSDQAQVVTEAAKTAVATKAGTIGVSESLALADTSPLEYAAGPVVQGAVGALSIPSVGLTDPTLRANLVRVVMTSTFGSLAGRTTGLANSQVFQVQKTMVGGGVAALTQAGLDGATAPLALASVTAGATASLAAAGVAAADASEAAGQIAKGAVESLGQLSIPDVQLSATLGATSGGVVANLAKAGVKADGIAAAAGGIVGGAFASLKVLSLPADKLLIASHGTANGAVGALIQAGVTASQVGLAAQTIASASVKALINVGIGADRVGDVAGAVTAGAIEGLATAGLTATQIVATRAVSQVVSGSVSGITAAGVSSSGAAAVMGKVAGAAVTAFAQAGLASPSQKSAALADVISGSMAGAGALSANNATLVGAAMTSIARTTVEALTKGGFDNRDIAAATALVVSTGMKAIISIGIKDAGEAIAISAKLTEGALAGAASLVATGVIDAAQAKAAAVAVSTDAMDALASLQQSGIITNAGDLGSFTGKIAESAMTGLAYGGASSDLVSSVQADVTSAMTSDVALAKLQISEAVKQSITANVASSTANALSISQAVRAGVPACATHYADGLADDPFWALVARTTPPVLCQLAATTSACPVGRKSAAEQALWQRAALAGACELTITWLTVPKIDPPSFTPSAGIYTGSQSVTLAAAPASATIIYTTDGSIPSATSGTVYTGPFIVAKSQTIAALAYKSGWTTSTKASAAYTIKTSPPGALTVTSGNLLNQLAWQSVPGASLYTIYWSVTAAPTAASAKIAATGTSFSHAGLVAGTTYYYMVTATVSGSESSGSPVASGTPFALPIAPTSLSAGPGVLRVILTWANVPGALGYNLYRSMTNPVSTGSTKLPNVTSGYLDADVTAGTTYYYMVTTTTAVGESPGSVPVTVTTSSQLLGAFDAARADGIGPYATTASLWYDLSGHSQSGMLTDLVHASWGGTGALFDPYALTLDGSASVGFPSSLAATQTKLMFSLWVNAASATTLDTVILGNSNDAMGPGFNLRQSAATPGALEFSVGSGTPSYRDLVFAAGVAGYWRLDEPSGTTAFDQSGHGNSGTYGGTISHGYPGALVGDANSAAYFDGNSAISLAPYPPGIPSGSSPYAITAWIRPADAGGSYGIAGWGNYGAGPQVNAFRTNGNSLYNYWWGPDLNVQANFVFDGNWHFVIAQYDGSIRSIWADGMMLISDVPGVPLAAPTSNVTIGKTWSGEYFRGGLDEVAIFGHALAAAQIADLYQAGKVGHGINCVTSRSFPSNQWLFVGGIYDGVNASLYVNGQQECSVPIAAALVPAATPIFAGATASNQNHWAGKIGDLKFYGTTDGSSPGDASDLSAYYGATKDKH